MVHAHDSAFQKCPHAFDGIGVDVATHELLGLVPHGLVLVGQVLQAGIGPVLGVNDKKKMSHFWLFT